MNTPLSNQSNNLEYYQTRQKEITELLEKERGLRHIIEIQIAQQGGDDFAQPGLIAQRESHNRKIDELKKELATIKETIDTTTQDNLIIIPFDKEIVETHPKVFKLSRKGILLLSVILLIFVLDIAIWQFKVFFVDVEQKVPIDSEFHHLGDNLYNEQYMQSISGDRIRNLTPEGTTYINTFTLYSQGQKSSQFSEIKEVVIYITINHLKPRRSSPVTMFINGHLIAYLNDFMKEERFKREQILIPIDVQYLTEGTNEVFIRVDQDEVEGDYEDMEFNDLGIVVTYSGGQPNILAFVIMGFVEVIIIGIVVKSSLS